MTHLDDILASVPGRCTHGFHPAQGHSCTYPSSPAAAWSTSPRASASAGEGSEWAFFASVLRKSARADGSIHQGDVRPLIRGRIPAKHIGQLWKRARNDGLIVDTGEWERSTDIEGRNGDKRCRVYALATQRGRPAA